MCVCVCVFWWRREEEEEEEDIVICVDRIGRGERERGGGERKKERREI